MQHSPGAVLALPALGFNMIHAVLRFPSFALGGLATRGAYAGWVANAIWGWAVAPSLRAAFAVVGTVGLVCAAVALARLRASDSLDATTAAELLTNGHRYLRIITGLPRTFRRLIAGETPEIGGRCFDVLSGGGHSPEQIMLHCPADGLLLAADQVLARISPNISVQENDPDGDPLGIYLRSHSALKDTVPDSTLVLPGHNLPFRVLHARIDMLTAHHAARCDAIIEACRTRRLNAAELVPVVFGRAIEDPHQMSFAFSEALAHANLLRRQGRLSLDEGCYAVAAG